MPKGRTQEAQDAAYQELMMSNQEMDGMVDRSMGLSLEPLPDGGVRVHIGQDPAGEGLVSISPMFMEKIGDFATAIESQFMGTYGEPKVQDPSVPTIQRNRAELERVAREMYGLDKNWPMMLAIRLLEQIAAENLMPQQWDRRNAGNSLADAANKLVDQMMRG